MEVEFPRAVLPFWGQDFPLLYALVLLRMPMAVGTKKMRLSTIVIFFILLETREAKDIVLGKVGYIVCCVLFVLF